MFFIYDLIKLIINILPAKKKHKCFVFYSAYFLFVMYLKVVLITYR
jgi:hypothetical protein